MLCLSALVYAPSIGAPFLFDDLELISNNKTFLEGEGIGEYAEKYRFRQEVMRSYKRDLALSGGTEPNPKIFHAANVLTHFAVVALFYWLLLALGRRIGFDIKARLSLAFLGTAIFSLHPLTTEPVAYVTGRADLLATWYSLLALVFFILPLSYQPENEEGPDAAQARVKILPAAKYWRLAAGCWAVALACFYKGIFCKEVAVVTPALIALVLLTVPGETRPWRRRTFVALGTAFVLVVGLLIARLIAFGTLGNPDTERPLFATLASNAFAVFRYLLLWFIPSGQSGDHDALIFPGFGHFIVLLSVVLITFFIWVGWSIRKRYPEVALGMLWCMVGLAPTTSFIALQDTLVERRFYLSAMGLALAAAGALTRVVVSLREREQNRLLKWRRPALIAGVAFLMLLSFQRVVVWTNAIRFWADAAAKAQIKSRPYFNLGTTLIEAGYSENAIGVFGALFKRNLYDVDAHLNVANAMMEAGWVDHAQRIYKSNVLQLDPDNAQARYNLGVIAEQKGAYNDAEQYYKEALHLKPDMADAAVKLGVFYFSRDEPRVAVKYFEEALATTPTDVLAHRYLALIYSQMLVDEEKALAHFDELTRLEPESAQNWFNLGVVQERMGKTDGARRSYRRVMDLEPANVDARVNLGALLERMGHHMEGCRLYREAAGLNPALQEIVAARCSDLGPPLDSAP